MVLLMPPKLIDRSATNRLKTAASAALLRFTSESLLRRNLRHVVSPFHVPGVISRNGDGTVVEQPNMLKLRASARSSAPSDEDRDNGGHERVLPWLRQKSRVGKSVQDADAEREWGSPVENLQKHADERRILQEIEDS